MEDISSLRINREKEEKGTHQRRWGWSLLVILLAAGIAVGLFFFSAAFRTPEVEIATAVWTEQNPANSILTASGYVVAQRKAAVASKGTGRLEYLGAEEGDRVIRGQVVARLEDDDVAAALVRARADLAVARADSAEAYVNYQRYQMLDSLEMTAKADLDAARTAFVRVSANIQAALARVREAEVAVENTIIYAPFDGTVLTKDADVGEIVAPFAASSNSRGAVVTIADMSSLEVETDVSESNITLVKQNQPCEIILDAYPDHRYPGYVKKIVPTADRGKATVMTKVAFRELDSRVLPEMSAKVQFLTEEHAVDDEQAILTLPSTSILKRGGATYVLLVSEGVVTEQPVKVGRTLQDRSEILAGVRQNDQVVRRPDGNLENGAKIRVKQ